MVSRCQELYVVHDESKRVLESGLREREREREERVEKARVSAARALVEPVPTALARIG